MRKCKDLSLRPPFNFIVPKRAGGFLPAIFVLMMFFIPPVFADTPPDFVSAAQKAKRSVVFIILGSDPAERSAGYGTGTIITGTGYIVTNYHVVKGERVFTALLPDGKESGFDRFSDNNYYIADPATDIAIMKLSGNGPFVAVETAPSSSLREGEWVLAVGNPYGLSSTITCGIVSSVHRSDVGFVEIEDFIQSDVPINPGNSGGPLVNLDGRMVGMNTAIRTMTGGYQGISFSIPSELVISTSDELIRYGYVRRGWIGLLVREAKGKKPAVYVDSVLDNSPAERAGIRRGDIIREANGRIISSKSELIQIVRNIPLNSQLALVVERNKRFFVTSIPLIERNRSGQ